MLVKLCGNPIGDNVRVRCSPGECVGIKKTAIEGEPDEKLVRTSYVERKNLNIRIGNHRFTRLTNAFSKKTENHWHTLSLYFVHYNFCRMHKSFRMSPAMAAGAIDTLRDMDRVVGLIDARTPKPWGCWAAWAMPE